MASLCRFYLYASTTWGIAVLLGLGSVLPMFLLVLDIVPIMVALGVLMTRSRRIVVGRATLLRVVGALALVLFVGGNLLSGTSRGGSIILACQYWGALLRPVAISLLALVVLHTSPISLTRRHRLYKTLLKDIKIIVCLHFFAAICQVIAPDFGKLLIPETSEFQSGFAALDEGNVSGLLPNSIDFAYMSVAAYVVLALDRLRRRQHPPNLAFTAVFAYFIHLSGSDAALTCFSAFVGWMYLARLPRRTRKLIIVATLTALLLAAVSNVGDWQGALVAKIENMMLSRLGLLLITAPQLVASQPSVLVLGLGPDFEMITGVLSGLPDALAVLSDAGGQNIVNDVFWFALVVSLGVPLAFGYTGLMLYLLRRVCGIFAMPGQFRTVFAILAIIIIIGGFFNQILLVRSFYSTLLIGLFTLALSGALKPPARSKAMRIRLPDGGEV